jgi:hypothetical protein
MVWFYTWSVGTIRVETLRDATTNEYVLKIEWPRRPLIVERFHDASSFDERIRALELELERQGCKQVGSPTILPHGWRGPMTH